jgi:hypothetical protein
MIAAFERPAQFYLSVSNTFTDRGGEAMIAAFERPTTPRQEDVSRKVDDHYGTCGSAPWMLFLQQG